MVFGDTEEKPVLSEDMEASSWRQQESPGATDDRTVSCSSSSPCNRSRGKTKITGMAGRKNSISHRGEKNASVTPE